MIVDLYAEIKFWMPVLSGLSLFAGVLRYFWTVGQDLKEVKTNHLPHIQASLDALLATLDKALKESVPEPIIRELQEQRQHPQPKIAYLRSNDSYLCCLASN